MTQKSKTAVKTPKKKKIVQAKFENTPITFNKDAGPDLTAKTAGKTIKTIEICHKYQDPFLIFNFEDGTSLGIKYDWIYSWELI
jgi:hypothetical protein